MISSFSSRYSPTIPARRVRPLGVHRRGFMARGGVDGFEHELEGEGVEGWKKFRRKVKKGVRKLKKSATSLVPLKKVQRAAKKAVKQYQRELKRAGKRAEKVGKKALKVVQDNPQLLGALSIVPGVGPMLGGALGSLGGMLGGIKGGEKYGDQFNEAHPGLAPFDMPSGGAFAETGGGESNTTKYLAIAAAGVGALVLLRGRK